jgi:hypothetical protein
VSACGRRRVEGASQRGTGEKKGHHLQPGPTVSRSTWSAQHGKTTMQYHLGGILNGFAKLWGLNIWFYSLGGEVGQLL